MRAAKRLAGLTTVLAVLSTGCTGRLSLNGITSQVSEERKLTAAHVSGAGLDVRSSLGSIAVGVDPALSEVSIVARITASANTEEDARARMAQVTIKVERRADKVLEIGVEYPKSLTNHPVVSFTVIVPDANGVTARSGNGSVALKGLGGDADARSEIGSVRVLGQKGAVEATSGNGSVTVERAAGKVRAESSIGSVTVKDVGAGVTAKSGNGTVSVSNAQGPVNATSSIGSVSVVGATGAIDAHSGNGSVHCEPAAGSTASFQLKSSIGSVSAKLPAGFGGRIKAETSIGSITVNGLRRPTSVSGDKRSKSILLTEVGPESKLSTGNGSVTVTLD